MAISLQRSGLTGRRIMNPLELSTVGLRRPINPLATEISPNSAALPGAETPGITGELSGNIKGQIDPERTAGLEPLTWDQVKGPLGMFGLGAGALLTAGASIPASLGVSAVNTGKALLLGKGLGYLGGKIKGALGFGGTQKEAPPSGLPTHGPQQGINPAGSFNTGNYDWGAGEESFANKGAVGETVAPTSIGMDFGAGGDVTQSGGSIGPSEAMDPSESFNTNDADWGDISDDGWF